MRLFAEMVRHGTILDATVWAYAPDNLAAGVAPERDAWPDLLHELDDLANRAGMPMSVVLSSATLIGARAAEQKHDMGSIEPGKLANMVVTSRDPLAGVDNLRSVVMTIKRGRVYRRDAFKPLRKGDLTDF